MSDHEPDRLANDPRHTAFETTCWSLVLAAADRATPQADEALASLCASYWYPLYAFIRRRGHGPDRAADLTQATLEGTRLRLRGHGLRLRGQATLKGTQATLKGTCYIFGYA